MAAVLCFPALAVTAGATEVDPAAIAAASTPADHQALAAGYEQQAADARAHARHHTAMGKNYQSDKWRVLGEHCEQLAKLYEAQAKEYDALAAAHAAAAKAK